MFTGGEDLTGLAALIHQAMMQHELNNGKGAYQISYAASGKSIRPGAWYGGG